MKNAPYAMFFTPVPDDEKLLSARVTNDGSRTLYSSAYGQTFHSDKGALTEAKHVFLAASGALKRLSRQRKTSILEVGFGTGLNFFVTADAALKHAAELHYTAFERDLLSEKNLKSLGYAAYLRHPELLEAYLSFRSGLPGKPLPGIYAFTFSSVGLELCLGEATEQVLEEESYDAVYQDAFSPDSNPELWTPEFLACLSAALVPGGALVTYSVKGAVRRTLSSASLEVGKLPGPEGGKREMLLAKKL